uniref:Uncharacterized protein n=1 Tax=Panagrolaimus sp. JU765 TaxID=591449 RepID=A0AC34R9S1_9BILA
MKFFTLMREIFVLGLLFQVVIGTSTKAPPPSTTTANDTSTDQSKEQTPPTTPVGNLTSVEPFTTSLTTEQTNTTNDQTTEVIPTVKIVPTPPVPSGQSTIPVNEAASFKQTHLLLIPALFYTYTCL